MSDESIADDIIRAGYDRWKRLEEEKAAIGDDLKELFAELKGQGFAPKALRESFRRVRNINDASQQEHDAIVDLYVAALTGARPARTREELPAHDPETGEIDDKAETPNEAAHTSHVAAARQAEEEVRASSAANSEAAGELVAPGLENPTPPSVAGPEAVESPAANSETSSHAGAGLHPASSPSAGTGGEIDRQPISEPASREATAEGAPGASVGPPAGAEDRSGGPKPAAHDPAPVQLDRTKPAPWCADPEDCGGASWTHTCGSCLRRRAQSDVMRAVQ